MSIDNFEDSTNHFQSIFDAANEDDTEFDNMFGAEEDDKLMGMIESGELLNASEEEIHQTADDATAKDFEKEVVGKETDNAPKDDTSDCDSVIGKDVMKTAVDVSCPVAGVGVTGPKAGSVDPENITASTDKLDDSDIKTGKEIHEAFLKLMAESDNDIQDADADEDAKNLALSTTDDEDSANIGDIDASDASTDQEANALEEPVTPEVPAGDGETAKPADTAPQDGDQSETEVKGGVPEAPVDNTTRDSEARDGAGDDGTIEEADLISAFNDPTSKDARSKDTDIGIDIALGLDADDKIADPSEDEFIDNTSVKIGELPIKDNSKLTVESAKSTSFFNFIKESDDEEVEDDSEIEDDDLSIGDDDISDEDLGDDSGDEIEVKVEEPTDDDATVSDIINNNDNSDDSDVLDSNGEIIEQPQDDDTCTDDSCDDSETVTAEGFFEKFKKKKATDAETKPLVDAKDTEDDEKEFGPNNHMVTAESVLDKFKKKKKDEDEEYNEDEKCSDKESDEDKEAVKSYDDSKDDKKASKSKEKFLDFLKKKKSSSEKDDSEESTRESAISTNEGFLDFLKKKTKEDGEEELNDSKESDDADAQDKEDMKELEHEACSNKSSCAKPIDAVKAGKDVVDDTKKKVSAKKDEVKTESFQYGWNK